MRCGSVCTTILNPGKRDRNGTLIAALTRTNCITVPIVRDIREIEDVNHDR